MKAKREAFQKLITGMGKELEAVLKRVKEPGTPEQRELATRDGRRLLKSLSKRVRALSEAGEPEPWSTHPTRERVAAAGQAPEKTIVLGADGKPEAISHRWHWPVQALHNRHITDARQYMAAARLRRAFKDAGGSKGVMNYGDSGRATNPAERTPITPEQERALKEFFSVWKYLERELQAMVWVLILEQPLPGDTHPLSVVEFGKRVGRSNTEEHARWFAFGALKIACIRLSSIYHRADIARGRELEEADARAEEQRKLHRLRVPNSRLTDKRA